MALPRPRLSRRARNAPCSRNKWRKGSSRKTTTARPTSRIVIGDERIVTDAPRQERPPFRERTAIRTAHGAAADLHDQQQRQAQQRDAAYSATICHGVRATARVAEESPRRFI